MKIKCNLCGDIIESKHRHDMVWCKCGACAIDGGNDYHKITGDIKNITIIKPDNYEILGVDRSKE